MAALHDVEIKVKAVVPDIDVRHNMTNHRPTDEEITYIECLREKFIALGEMVQACPASRERSLALTNLEQALMWAVASIARNTENEEG